MTGPISEFSDYIVFVDESGSPTLSPIDPNHPVFVLVFCAINKWTYCDVIQPAIKRLKFEFFGHDMAVLHSHEIRKRSGEFAFLMNEQKRAAFLARLDQIILEAEVDVIASVINKVALRDTEMAMYDPYHLAMGDGLTQLYKFLDQKRQRNSLTHIIAKLRGKAEDKDLMKAFDAYQAMLRSRTLTVTPICRKENQLGGITTRRPIWPSNRPICDQASSTQSCIRNS